MGHFEEERGGDLIDNPLCVVSFSIVHVCGKSYSLQLRTLITMAITALPSNHCLPENTHYLNNGIKQRIN